MIGSPSSGHPLFLPLECGSEFKIGSEKQRPRFPRLARPKHRPVGTYEFSCPLSRILNSVPHAHEPGAFPVGAAGDVVIVGRLCAVLHRLRDRGPQEGEEEREDEGGEESGGARRRLRDGRGYAGE